MNYTLKVDPITSTIHVINDAPCARSNIIINSNNDRSVLRLRKNSKEILCGDMLPYGAIYFERNDGQGLWTTSYITGGEDYILFASSANGTIEDPKLALTWRNGKLGVGTTTPKSTIDVIGNIYASDTIEGKLKMPSYIKNDLNNINAKIGMIVYVTDQDCVAVYNGKLWKKIKLGDDI